MKYTREQAEQRVFDTCNLIGIDANIYTEMDKYSVLKKLTDKEKDEIEEAIAKSLGF